MSRYQGAQLRAGYIWVPILEQPGWVVFPHPGVQHTHPQRGVQVELGEKGITLSLHSVDTRYAPAIEVEGRYAQGRWRMLTT